MVDPNHAVEHQTREIHSRCFRPLLLFTLIPGLVFLLHRMQCLLSKSVHSTGWLSTSSEYVCLIDFANVIPPRVWNNAYILVIRLWVAFIRMSMKEERRYKHVCDFWRHKVWPSSWTWQVPFTCAPPTFHPIQDLRLINRAGQRRAAQQQQQRWSLYDQCTHIKHTHT